MSIYLNTNEKREEKKIIDLVKRGLCVCLYLNENDIFIHINCIYQYLCVFYLLNVTI